MANVNASRTAKTQNGGIARNSGLDLANSLASAIKGLARAFGLVVPPPEYPEYKSQGISGDYERAHWFDAPRQGYYSLTVNYLGEEQMEGMPKFIQNIKSMFCMLGELAGILPKTMKFGEFVLPINPQEINQTEDFAVSLRPTQGGTVVNHSGNKYKTLIISGTTGVMPGRNYLGVLKPTGQVIAKPDELPYQSGYEVFLHLRTWIKAYHESKILAGQENLRMVWRNYKDWEFLYVEPIKFTMRRDAQKPLLYNYNIQFRVTGVVIIAKPIYDTVVSKTGDVSSACVNSYALLKANTDATGEIKGIVTGFIQSYNSLKMAVQNANKGAPTAGNINAKDLSKLSPRDMKYLLLGLGNTMQNLATAQPTVRTKSADPAKVGTEALAIAKNPAASAKKVAKAAADLLNTEPHAADTIRAKDLPASIQAILAANMLAASQISKDQIKDLQSQADSLSLKMAKLLGLDDATYSAILGLPTVVTVPLAAPTDDQFEAMYALVKARLAITDVLSTDAILDANTNKNKVPALNSADVLYANTFQQIPVNSGVASVILLDNVTLEDIALSELGDSSKWTQLAELNHLKPPYILNSRLNISYNIESANYYNPLQIQHLVIASMYLVPATPTPTGAWYGKGNHLARYNGSDLTQANNWTFIYPDEGMVVQTPLTGDLFSWSGGAWTLLSVHASTLDGVLRPGDSLKIPVAQTQAITFMQGPRDNVYTNIMTPSEAALGVDLQLTEQNDLHLNPSGDLNVAAGVINGAQAIIQKLLVEKGSYKKYPLLGTTLTPGMKMPALATVREEITRTLIQDPRIRDIVNINIEEVGNTLNLTFDVYFYNVGQPVPVNIPI